MSKKVKKMAFGGQTAQTAKPGTKPPTVMPAGMNPNFKGFGAGPTSFNAAKVNQVKGLLGGKPANFGITGGPLVKPPPPGMTGQLAGMNPNAKALIAAAKPTYTGPGFGPSAPFNKAKMDQIKSSLYGKPTMKKGGKVSSASKRADGIATKGKTKGRMV